MNRAEFDASYVGFPSFFRAPMAQVDEVEEGAAAVYGVPMDMGIVFARPGAKYGPRAIRESSHFYRAVHDVAVEQTVVHADTYAAPRLRERPGILDLGDIAVYSQDLTRTGEAITSAVSEVVKRGALPVLLGGDHYLTYPSFEGLAKGVAERKTNAQLGHVHIDSHHDFRDGYRGLGRYNHGTCVGRDSARIPWYPTRTSPGGGINGNVLDAEIYRTQSLRLYSAGDIRSRGIERVVEKTVKAAADGTGAVYVSIDIDVVDVSHSTGTGALVPEGIEARDLLRATELLGTYESVGAVDLCEVAPPLDPSGRTQHLAASALVGLLSRRLFDTVQLEA